jgi:hypothetical protein
VTSDDAATTDTAKPSLQLLGDPTALACEGDACIVAPQQGAVPKQN